MEKTYGGGLPNFHELITTVRPPVCIRDASGSTGVLAAAGIHRQVRARGEINGSATCSSARELWTEMSAAAPQVEMSVSILLFISTFLTEELEHIGSDRLPKSMDGTIRTCHDEMHIKPSFIKCY